MIAFASEKVRFYPAIRVLATDQLQRKVADRQFSVLYPLAINLGEIVPIEELIDITNPGLVSETDRFIQRGRVGSYIGNLRGTLDQLIPGIGDPETGVIQNEFGEGYYLCEFWHPEST